MAVWTWDSSETKKFFQLSFLFGGFCFFVFLESGHSTIPQKAREKHTPSLRAAFPILKQFLVQMHSLRGSEVTGVFVLSSMVVTNKLLFPFLRWHRLQQRNWLNFYICGLHVHYSTEGPWYFIYTSAVYY